jgi:hypothetical protein
MEETAVHNLEVFSIFRCSRSAHRNISRYPSDENGKGRVSTPFSPTFRSKTPPQNGSCSMHSRHIAFIPQSID